jgi:isopenicillin N synthase-like dioxygenase
MTYEEVVAENRQSWEVFTILWQQPGIQALEVQNESGQWLPAPPIEGTLVIK